MIRPKGLGRGLDALLSGSDEATVKESLQTLSIDRLRPGKYQPRTRMDEASLDELAESIKEHGIMQPVLVRPVDGGGFEILAGERRWRAAQRAGLKDVPALVKTVPDASALAIGLIENIQREDLNPLEQANGLKRLIEEFKLTHDEVAQAIGRSRAGVTNLLRLLELAASVQAMVQEGRIDMGHARALLALGKSRQVELAERIAQQGLSVRETERLVQAAAAAPRAARASGPRLDSDSRRLQEELAESLGASVKLKPRRGGKGSVIIDYSSLDELQGIVGKLRRA